MQGGLTERLRVEWRTDVGRWGASEDDIDAVFDDLVACYSEAHRHYHTIQHIATVLRSTEGLAPDADDIDAVRFAAWYHDAVYDPRASNNEARSAVLAAMHLASLAVPAEKVQECARLIELTATHQPAGRDRNGAVLVDADLWILAVSPDRYDRYRDGVRAEYSHVDDQGFRSGRAEVLRSLLDRPNIYRTTVFRTDREPRARWNLERELRELTEDQA